MDLFLKTKGLTHFFKVIWYAKSENQCLHAEKWRLIERKTSQLHSAVKYASEQICIFMKINEYIRKS